MTKSSSDSRQVRISDALWKLVGEIGQELDYDDARGVHSAVMREMISATSAKWKHSPYVCRSSDNFIFVNSRGDLFGRHAQVLKLNADREFLPCAIEMKAEKKRAYSRSCPKGTSQSDWLKSRWWYHLFVVSKGQALEGERLGALTDPDGSDSKEVDLRVSLGNGRYLLRQTLVGFKDYVQWKESKIGYDRVDMPIDIPTRNLDLTVVVDEDLYRSSSTPEAELPDLDIEFRNREGARFSGTEVGRYPENLFEGFSGRFPRDNDSAEEVLRLLKLFRQSALSLFDEKSDGDAIVAEADRNSLRQALKLPERFLFYRLFWPSPHLGIQVCVRWEKPVKSL